jgi:molybdenum cofactor cytidylyltransferase
MICAIVLAAGRSERMGTQKLLLPIGGKPVITGIVDEIQQSPLQLTIVVTGHDGKVIQAALKGREATFVENPEPQGDMLSSIRCGLRAIPEQCTAVLVVLGDQPGINAELVFKLIDVFTSSGRGIVVPTHLGHRGHPVLIAARFRDELLRQHDDLGLRGLLDVHHREIQQVEVANAMADIDTPEDYQRLLNSANIDRLSPSSTE